MSLAQYSKEQLKEFSLIELAFEYLKNSKQPIAFNDLVNEIKAATNISQEEIRARLAQFYTDLNIDGRFLSLGENRWGLRVWYPVDTAEEEVVTVTKPKKKKAKKVVDEDLDDYDEIEEDDYDDVDEFEEDEDLLDDEDDLLDDEIDDLDDFEEEDEEDAIEEEEDFDLGDEEELDDDLDEVDDEIDEDEEDL